MHQRAAIEGTLSELVQAHAARRSRYRGLPKNQLQAAFTAAATNLKRLARALHNNAERLTHAFTQFVHFTTVSCRPSFSTESLSNYSGSCQRFKSETEELAAFNIFFGGMLTL